MIPEELEGDQFKEVLNRILAKANYYVLGAQLVEDAAPKGIRMIALGTQQRPDGTQLFFRFSTLNDIAREALEGLVREIAAGVDLKVLHFDWHPGNEGRMLSGVVCLLWESINPIDGVNDGSGYVGENVMALMNRQALAGRIRVLKGGVEGG